MDRTVRFLKDLVDAHGAPGYEGPVAPVMERQLKGVGTFSRDRLGSFICEKQGTARQPARDARRATSTRSPSWCKSITKDGFIKFLPLGGLVGPRGARPAPDHQDPQGRRAGRGGLEAAARAGRRGPQEGDGHQDDVHRRRRVVRLGREEEARHPSRRSDPSRLGVRRDGEPEPAAGQGVGQPDRLRDGGRDRAATRKDARTRTRCSASRPCRRRSVCAARRPRRSR